MGVAREQRIRLLALLQVRESCRMPRDVLTEQNMRTPRFNHKPSGRDWTVHASWFCAELKQPMHIAKPSGEANIHKKGFSQD
jgi:hypothetical protein